MRITVFDYGAGNLHSLVKALAGAGRDIRVEPDPAAAARTDLLVLPGVGSFASAAARLVPGRDAMRRALADGVPCLGICLGMQLMFDASDEGPGAGLGIFPGRVRRLRARRVPQIGWNDVTDATDPLFARAALRQAYYANSFVCAPDDPRAVIAWSAHETDRFPAAVRAGRVLGVQFHPEKSSEPGVCLIHEFVREEAA
ncbi:MAG: imidazole glycerol phosphate synthase subunit HisH [Gemmatimonadota bacterium]|nr:imidazole glycerol phosphate synthase subunit HisH [Gemmatimonadota bacterium]MDE3126375.1 imidazole glycerol phosphate synthase subunit HisH [Gemmatimonadota bacterium]MDE3171486.1 imidazole glycerol phosphate synthase subunit HisH [Gemmatimonadota bacterium]MDE3214770.1 imidazole glycerol phosphate synthase subunit HisH [Gemmatimonadota bacterium]